jgi:hypothetical protein
MGGANKEKEPGHISDLKYKVLQQSGKVEDQLIDKVEGLCPDIPWVWRMVGFVVCGVIGWFLTFYATFAVLGVAAGNISSFAIMFSLSQILCYASFCFFSGPKSQVRDLKKPGRLLATLLMLVALIMTLVSSLFFKSFWLTLVFVILSVAAYIWYTCTLFPCGKRLCKNCFKAVVEN